MVKTQHLQSIISKNGFSRTHKMKKDSCISKYLHIRSPQSEVIAKKLHYKSAVLVRILSQGIQFCNCFIKSLVEIHNKTSAYSVQNFRFITIVSWMNKMESRLSPALQDYKHGQVSSGSHSKTRRSWVPVLVGLDGWELVPHLQYPARMKNVKLIYLLYSSN